MHTSYLFCDIFIRSCVAKLNIQFRYDRRWYFCYYFKALLWQVFSYENEKDPHILPSFSLNFVANVCQCCIPGLDNGLSLTPPMGWLSWERFRCNTDCDNDPEFCIGENLFKQVSGAVSYLQSSASLISPVFLQMADMLVTGGYKEVGYDTVIIDDCWLDHKR